MKKILSLTILLLAFCMALTACSAPGQESKPEPSVQPPPSASEHVPVEKPGSKIEFIIPDGMKDEMPVSSLTLNEAQALLADTLHPEEGISPQDGYRSYYRFCGLVEIEGTQFYHIEFGTHARAGFIAERNFAVGPSGEIYEGTVFAHDFVPYESFDGGATSAPSAEEAMGRVELALELLEIDNVLIWRTEDEVIEEIPCMTFAAGTNGDEEDPLYYFAVGGILTWYKETGEGAAWVPFDLL